MKEFELAVEFLSFYHERKVINRRVFRVIFDLPKYHYIAEVKVSGNKLYVNPRLTYQAFQRLLAEHFKATMINFKWLTRIPLLEDVINFEWKLKENNPAPTI